MALGLVIMSERELNRIEVLSQVTRGVMTAVTAANVLGLSRRQVHRLLKDRKLIRHTARRDVILERSKDGWTPEQIVGCLLYEKASVRVCQQPIYRLVSAPAEVFKEKVLDQAA